MEGRIWHDEPCDLKQTVDATKEHSVVMSGGARGEIGGWSERWVQSRVFSPDRKKWVPGNKLNIVVLKPFTSLLAPYGGRSGTTAFELVCITTAGRVGGWLVG